MYFKKFIYQKTIITLRKYNNSYTEGYPVWQAGPTGQVDKHSFIINFLKTSETHLSFHNKFAPSPAATAFSKSKSYDLLPADPKLRLHT